MLHNTGTFDKQEVPIIQNNQNNLSSENRIISSNNNLPKTNEPGQMHFSVPYHVNLGLSQYNPDLEANVQNYRNMLPMNLNVQNESLMAFHRYETSHTNDKGHTKNTLNLPQVYTKAYHKQMDIDCNYFNSYKKSTYDVNVNESNPMALSLSEDVRISSDKPNTDEETISQDSSYQLDLSRKPVNTVNTNNITDLSNKLLRSDSRQRLANTVKIIENIISHPSNSRRIKQEYNTKSKDSEELSSETPDAEISSGSIKTKKIKKLKPSVTKQKNSQKPVKSKSCSDDGRMKIDIKDAVVKTEIVPSVSNFDQINPFLKDTNGVQSEGKQNCEVIRAESSISVAKEMIKNGSLVIATLFECPHCKLLFDNTKRFLIHTKWHTFGYITEKRLRSQKERIVRPRSRKYKISETTQQDTDEGTIPCGECKRMFASRASLMNHKRKYHPTRQRECKICGKTMVGLAALRTHIATHSTESRFQCDGCPKWFKYAHSLAKHRDTHLEKTQECPQCPKKFGSPALLNVHMKTHERVLRGATFRCTYCGKGFFESYSLQAHERTHRNERPFLCEICNTSFGTNSSLKRHLKVSHSTSKPYECTTCHRSFVSESIRDRHSVRYHGNPDEFKYICKQCPCKYLNARELRRHIYKVHPKPKMKIEVESD